MAKPRKKDDFTKQMKTIDTDEMLNALRNAVNRASTSGTEILNFTPNVDIFSNAETLVVEVEVPGVPISEIELSFVSNNILVKGVKYEGPGGEKGNFICMERGFGRFFRSIELPFPIDTRSAKAFYKDGLLKIEAPRVEDKRGQPKKIEIKSI